MAKSGALVLSLVGLGIVGGPAHAASTTVYRCLDAHLEVVYTDIPCKEGSAFEVSPGDADPAAVARLERVRDALDQSAAQRLTAERIAARSVVVAPMRGGAEADDDDSDYGYYTYPVAGYGYAPDQRHPHRPRVDHHHDHARGGAPSPPYVVPRR